MRRAEALLALGAAIALVAAGLTWLFGAWALVGVGVVVIAVVLLVDIRE